MDKIGKNKLTPAEVRDMLQGIFADVGIKLTPQRIEIFRAVYRTDAHPSAEAIHSKVEESMPSISLDTVYRTLATFEKLGLINRVSAFDRQVRFDANTTPHHHFICTVCGMVSDFYWPSFDKIKLPQDVWKKGKVISKHLEIRGVCKKCSG